MGLEVIMSLQATRSHVLSPARYPNVNYVYLHVVWLMKLSSNDLFTFPLVHFDTRANFNLRNYVDEVHMKYCQLIKIIGFVRYQYLIAQQRLHS